MEVQRSLRARSYLEDRRNFMKVWSLSVGVLFGLALLWMFGNYGGVGWWLFIFLVALATGRVSAFFMWFVFKNVYAIDEPKDANSGNSKGPGVRSNSN